jgi:hypothetical protein
MAKSTRYLLSAVAVIALTFFTVVGFLSRVGPVEHPPCAACNLAEQHIDEVTVCDLKLRSQELAGKQVRVTGDFRNDSGYFFLESHGCSVHAGFAPNKPACHNAFRKLQIICGIDTWYEGSAPVRVVGALSNIPGGELL